MRREEGDTRGKGKGWHTFVSSNPSSIESDEYKKFESFVFRGGPFLELRET